MLHMRRGPVFGVLVLIGAAAFAQRFGGEFRRDSGRQSTEFPAQGEFHFARLEYTDLPQYRRGFGFRSRNAQGDGWWMQDWPDCDEHFTMGVRRLTRIDVGEFRHFRIADTMDYRTYTARQMQALLSRIPDFEVAALYDFTYDIGTPIEITPETEDVVFILKKK